MTTSLLLGRLSRIAPNIVYEIPIIIKEYFKTPSCRCTDVYCDFTLFGMRTSNGLGPVREKIYLVVDF